jgi:hypothetical protein
MRETTQVTLVAQGRKPCAKTGRSTQTNSSSACQVGKSVKAVKSPDLGIQRMRQIVYYFNSNYGRWAPSGISIDIHATALSSKSTPSSTLVT